MSRTFQSKEELWKAVRLARKHVCAYANPLENPLDAKEHFGCDCKYGLTAVGGMGEQGNGCPELREVEALFQAMTPREFERLCARAVKSPRFRAPKEKKT